jgi:hypothetical protein
MNHERLCKLFQASLGSLKKWNAFVSHIDSPRYFGSRSLALIYDTAVEEVAKLKDVPSADGLATMLHEKVSKACAEGQPLLDNMEWEFVWGLVQGAPDVQLTESEISAWAGESVAELRLMELADEAQELDVEKARVRLREYITQLDRAAAATDITSDDLDMENLREVALAEDDGTMFTPTRIPFIDKYIGGFAPKEIYSCLGPSGACKTSTAVQVAVEYAKTLSVHQHTSFGRRPRGLIFYVTTEDGAVKIRDRMVCCAGKIPLAKVNGKDKAPKSNAGNPTTADRKICEDYWGGTIFGEIEREKVAIGRNRKSSDQLLSGYQHCFLALYPYR